MKKVRIDDVEPAAPPDENVPEGAMATSIGDVRQLTDRLGAIGVSLNYFEFEPGESSAHSMHKHPHQEEVFYVLSGTVTVERPGEDVAVDAGGGEDATVDDAGDQDVTVSTDEVVRVPPDTYQFLVNRSDRPATVLALGAPREYEGEGSYIVHCPACGEYTEQTFDLVEADGEPRAIVCECLQCGGESHRIEA